MPRSPLSRNAFRRSAGRRRAIAAVAAMGLPTLLALGGCGAGRSAQAFCSTMDKHKARYLTAMNTAIKTVDSDAGNGMGLLSGGAQAISALSDLQRMWEELADVAPKDIQSDVEAIRDENAKQMEAAKEALDNPLKALGGALIGGLQVSGSYQRVDDFTKANCKG